MQQRNQKTEVSMRKIPTRYMPIALMNGCWTLTKEGDENFIKQSASIEWIEWEESGRMKGEFDTISIGRSLLLSPFNTSYTWLTTPVTEVIKQEAAYIEFKTENSHYTLHYDRGTIS